ncbi:MAG TPA: rhomboid family intramembrane serine protease [bacterium]|nr:rhomboid family intramembrane serine protease [bacterium]HPP29561.1 rhomboid family intramembrane serine protease [bacterium]
MFFVFPVRDEFGIKRFPSVVVSIIAVNVLIFFLYGIRPEYIGIVNQYGFIPSRFSLITLFTSMFLHGGLLHLGFNMWYLWLFGDNIEDRWGHILFLLFYLSGGIFAALLYSVLIPEAMKDVPTIGASGAISAVLGAYAVLFPKSAIIFKYFFFAIIVRFGEFELYSYVWLALWFLQQAVSTFLAGKGITTSSVAFGAHFAGFVYGMVIGIGTKLYIEAKYRENVEMGKNMLFQILGRKQFIQRGMEEYGEIEEMRSKILEAMAEENKHNASELYAKLIRKYPEITLPERFQYEIAQVLVNNNLLYEASIAYKNFIITYPFSKLADNALLNLAKIFTERGEEEKARYVLMQIVLFYPYSDVYEEAKYLLEKKTEKQP